VHRDVSADRWGLSALRAALLAMTAGAVPQPPRPLGAGAGVTPAAPPFVLGGAKPAPEAPANGARTAAGSAPSGGSAPGAEPPASVPPQSDQRKAETPPRPDAESARMLALVKRAQDGDGEAFGRLYDTYMDTVYRYIYYRVSNRALAEDLTSETFLRALRRISTFTWQGRDFGAWLVTIARNLVADHFKSSRHRLEVPTGEMLDSDQTEPSPEDSVLAYLSNRALLDAVKQLNSQQQECVTLRFLHGLSVAETALIMGKNDGAIKTLQYRAIRTLARLLPADLR
jgi:RNA polymerase sigma-70 factor (ECF subfamily)